MYSPVFCFSYCNFRWLFLYSFFFKNPRDGNPVAIDPEIDWTTSYEKPSPEYSFSCSTRYGCILMDTSVGSEIQNRKFSQWLSWTAWQIWRVSSKLSSLYTECRPKLLCSACFLCQKNGGDTVSLFGTERSATVSLNFFDRLIKNETPDKLRQWRLVAPVKNEILSLSTV